MHTTTPADWEGGGDKNRHAPTHIRFLNRPVSLAAMHVRACVQLSVKCGMQTNRHSFHTRTPIVAMWANQVHAHTYPHDKTIIRLHLSAEAGCARTHPMHIDYLHLRTSNKRLAIRALMPASTRIPHDHYYSYAFVQFSRAHAFG